MLCCGTCGFWHWCNRFWHWCKMCNPVIDTTTVQNKAQTRCFSRSILHFINCKVILRFLLFSSCYKRRWVFAQRFRCTTVQTVQISFYNTWESLTRQGTWICLNFTQINCILSCGWILIHYHSYFDGKSFFSLCKIFLGLCNKSDSLCNHCAFYGMVICNTQ